MNINYLINQLINYGVKEKLIEEYDMIYCANELIDIFHLNTFEFEETDEIEINVLLEQMCDYAYEHNIIDSNDVTVYDLFDTKLMDVLMPTPSTVKKEFYRLFNKDKTLATNYYYNLAIKSNYIRMDRINKNICFKHDCEYGKLDVTINLSKPEKDPKMIALAKTLPSSGYPKCALCYENMGFAGNLNQAARQNHRIMPITLDGDDYFFQYSPYVYYNEHTIVFNKKTSLKQRGFYFLFFKFLWFWVFNSKSFYCNFFHYWWFYWSVFSSTKRTSCYNS
jgi:UDPglucose--hexose-1-phosphate uridylyltransferase